MHEVTTLSWGKIVVLGFVIIALGGCGAIELFRPDSKIWLTLNKRKTPPLKPQQVPPRPFAEPSLIRLAATPPLRFFEYSENKLIALTWDLSDWDRAILDGDIQRTLNNPSSEPFQWKAQGSSRNTALLRAGSSYTKTQATNVRRLHILNQTPRQIKPVTGQWRSWKGALLRTAPTHDSSKVIGRLAPATKTKIIGEVNGLDNSRWALIAFEGIGIGYVHISELVTVDGKFSAIPGASPRFYQPINLDFTPTIVDPVNAAVLCRNFTVSDIHIDACQGLDGRWRAI